jgi:hypothetical protein
LKDAVNVEQMEETHRLESQKLSSQFQRILKQKQKMIDALLEEQATAADTGRDGYELEAENARLVARIKEYSFDLEAARKERNKLMELSNSAQAELRFAKDRQEQADHGVQTGI